MYNNKPTAEHTSYTSAAALNPLREAGRSSPVALELSSGAPFLDKGLSSLRQRVTGLSCEPALDTGLSSSIDFVSHKFII